MGTSRDSIVHGLSTAKSPWHNRPNPGACLCNRNTRSHQLSPHHPSKCAHPTMVLRIKLKTKQKGNCLKCTRQKDRHSPPNRWLTFQLACICSRLLLFTSLVLLRKTVNRANCMDCIMPFQ